jgi:hypothetical protein
MRKSLIHIAANFFVYSSFVHLPAVLFGFQLHTVGHLVVQSTPHQGANIYINQQATGQTTNATFGLSPGTYWVAVTGGPDGLNCSGAGGKAVIASNSTVTLTCGPNGWQ